MEGWMGGQTGGEGDILWAVHSRGTGILGLLVVVWYI